MASLNHVHTYVKYSKTQMKCDDPYCTHLQLKDRLLGKITRCSVCKRNEFVLTKQDLKRVRPRCIECSETRAAKSYRDNKARITQELSKHLNPDVFNSYLSDESKEK